MLIAGLAIIGFTSIGLATQEKGKQSEDMQEEGSAPEAKSDAESKEDIQYSTVRTLNWDLMKKKLRQKEENSFRIWRKVEVSIQYY